MKRKYVYIIVMILCSIFAVSEYYVDLSIEEVVDLSEFETQRYLDTADIDKLLNIENEMETDDESYKEIKSGVSLTITNSQNDTNRMTYSYKITVSGATGAYRYSYGNDEKYLIFSSTNETEITLKSNETLTIYDLPSGSSYTIEQSGGNSNKYTIKVNDIVGNKTTGNLNSKDNKVLFDNKVAVKDDNKVPNNPYTADIYTLGIILFLVTAFIFIAIRFIKINRFE